MIGADAFSTLFGASVAGDDEALPRLVTHAVRAGFAVVLLRPGSKVPLCTLSARQASTADREAKLAAQEAGDPRWEHRKHACGLHHAITDDTKAAPTVRRVAKAHGQLNIGVELGRSRMIVVDCDTRAEVAAWAADWAAEDDHDVPGATVLSPGVRRDDGTWLHSDGGHYWFTVPDGVELPTGTGSYRATTGEGYMVMWSDKQVLVPPSVRPEGAYRLVGETQPAPSWLLERISRHVEARRERTERVLDQLSDGGTDIDAWGAATPWAELLEPDGWTDTGLVDRCSCPIWTAPGTHASPKSATAHDAGCDRYSTITGWGPLHVWTDNPPEYLPPETKTYSKLGYVAARDHGGDQKAALLAIGMVPQTQLSEAERPYDMAEELAAYPLVVEQGLAAHPKESRGDSEPGEDSEPTEDELDAFLARFKTSTEMRDLEPPEPLLEDLLFRDTIVRVVGKPGQGKTHVMSHWAWAVATGQDWEGRATKQGLAVYMVAEGVSGWAQRLRAWEDRHRNGHPIDGAQLLVMPDPIQIRDREWQLFVKACDVLKPSLVVLDTQARVTVGVEENSNTEMGVVYDRLEALRKLGGITVALVHHLGHNGNHGRGASAINGAIHTEILVEMGKGQVITVSCLKQKDAELFEPMQFVLVPEGNSVVLESVGAAGDPFDDAVQIGPESPARDRLAQAIHDTFPRRGCTKAEARQEATKRVDKPMRLSDSTFYRTWDAMVADGVLAQVVIEERPTAQFKLDPSEVKRLGLDHRKPKKATHGDDMDAE